jgi:rhodanese-related sulfurtransferase
VNTDIISSSRGKVAVGAVVVALFLFAFVYAQPAAACEQIPQPAAAYGQTLLPDGACQQIPQPGTYQNVSVQVAHQMIEEDHYNQILILDVRYQCEYNMGHLYGAVLMPYDQLQANISNFQAYKNSVIIVYCKTDVRSTIDAEILADNGLTHVYNMMGGIFAWINAGYQIYTTEHYVTVNMADSRILLEIEPLLLYQTGPPPCTQNTTHPSVSLPSFQYTVLEQNETYRLTQVTFEFNGTTSEYTLAGTLLWSYSSFTDEGNRTASFASIDVTGPNLPTRFYTLSYLLQTKEYNVTLETLIEPLSPGAYNMSSTAMNYKPVDNSGVISFESVKYNTSVTLSSQYAILGDVAKKLGKLYRQSQDENLTQLASRYDIMGREAGFLSKLVSQQLQQYNLPALTATAALVDNFFTCLACEILVGYGVIGFCALCCATTGACCYCLDLIALLPLDVLADMMCTTLGACP